MYTIFFNIYLFPPAPSLLVTEVSFFLSDVGNVCQLLFLGLARGLMVLIDLFKIPAFVFIYSLCFLFD